MVMQASIALTEINEHYESIAVDQDLRALTKDEATAVFAQKRVTMTR